MSLMLRVTHNNVTYLYCFKNEWKWFIYLCYILVNNIYYNCFDLDDAI